MNMTIRQTCAYVLMASGMMAFAGCSAWGPSSKGEAQLERSAVEGQSKSLAGVYEDVDLNGSIKSHPLEVGTGGRTDGVVIGGGPVDMPNIRTGQMETKGTANQTPKLKIGEKTMTPGSDSK
ncbi:MAG: hypothetical protein QM706_15895 [Nitrospira sp.]